MPIPSEYLDTSALLRRDAKSTLTPNATQETTLIVAACYIVVIAILWYVSTLSPFDHKYQIRNFQGMYHTLSLLVSVASHGELTKLNVP